MILESLRGEGSANLFPKASSSNLDGHGTRFAITFFLMEASRVRVFQMAVWIGTES